MLNYKKTALILFIAAIACSINAQYTINSPYSRYAYGDLNYGGTSFNQAMGGTGLGMRESNNINYLNPASYNSQDSMSFIWDFGVMGNMKKSETNSASMSMKTMNFDHIAFSFPVTRQYFFAAGIVPYSKIGYNIKETGTVDTLTYTGAYSGSGNLNQLFLGNSIGFLKKTVNIGINLNYLFGYLNQSRTIDFTETNVGNSVNLINEYKLHGWNATVGVQIITRPVSNLSITWGATYQTKTTLNGNNVNRFYNGVSEITSDTLNPELEIPARLGLGLSFHYKSNIILALDYSIQNWKNATVPGENTALKSNNRFNAGIQITPDRDSYISYLNRIRYRFGAYMDNTYLKLNNTNIDDYGLSVGFGLPFKRTNTMFNAALEYGFRGTLSNNLIRENYFRMTMSVSLYDFWFIKRKYN